MNWHKLLLTAVLAVILVTSFTGCAVTLPSASGSYRASSASHTYQRPDGWDEETHGDTVEPDYETVFPPDEVNQLKITIAPEDWEAMQANMVELFGEPGAAGAGFPGQLPGGDNATRDFRIPEAGELPLPGGGGFAPPGGMGDMTPDNPMWVPATIEFEGNTWTNVGVRYKGNSSLMSGWRSDTLKLPFKLDFDEFEVDHPEIVNQRFYGFKQLSLSNAFSDGSYMRDVITADILADAGLVAARSAYYEIILDYGEGPVNLGLYVAMEVIDDTVIDRYFGEDSGNIYEGEGPGVSLARGTFDHIETSFFKENNRIESDWSDIEELYEVLHSSNRTTDPEAWREALESVFDVDTFLEWLAISAIIQHWDAYGQMAHNFYLYHDPDTGLLTWISWDHNMVLGVDGGMGARGNMGGIGRASSLGRDEIGQNWPLIRYLLDDPVYHDLYLDYMEETVNGAFNPETLEQKCRELESLIAPYVTRNTSRIAFGSAVQGLIDNIYERYRVTTDFLADAGR